MADDKKKDGDAQAAKSAADEARQRAQAARAAGGTATAADVARAGSGDKVAPAEGEVVAGEQVVQIPASQLTELLSRMASMETLLASSRGLEGPAADATKSTAILTPAAVNSPQHAVRSASITSAPSGQPIAKSTSVLGLEANPAAIGSRQRVVENARVLLTKTHYIADVIRNEGEVLEGYTGPLGSGMVEVDDGGRPINRAA